MIGHQHEFEAHVCLVYSLHYGRVRFKSRRLELLALLSRSHIWIPQTPQTIINTTFCQTQPSAMLIAPVCVLSLPNTLVLLSISVISLCPGSTQAQIWPTVKYYTLHRWD